MLISVLDLNADETREMMEGAENCGLEEELELERSQDEFSKCKMSKITYPRALLLELTKVEVCRKLPRDFDLLFLRQIHEGSDAAVEHKSIFGRPIFHGPMLTTLDLASLGESRLYTWSKESHSPRNCCLERKDVRPLLPEKPERDAGIQKSGIFHLSKTMNPYCPPHLNKKIPPPTPTFYKPEVESPGEPDKKGSDDKSGNIFPIAGIDDLTKGPLIILKSFKTNNEEKEVTESSEEVDECEDVWWEKEGNKLNACVDGLMEDGQSTFDEFWAEILETIHIQQDTNTSSPADEESSLTPVEKLNRLNLDHDHEFGLPDEEGLILIEDVIAPQMIKKLESGCGMKLGDRSESLRLSCEGW